MATIPSYDSKHNPYTGYELVDPRDNLPFYVGITDNVYRRLKEHIRCNGDNPDKDARMRELHKEQEIVIMRPLFRAKSYIDALSMEAEWISKYMTQGIQLLNIVVPGEKRKIESSFVQVVGGLIPLPEKMFFVGTSGLKEAGRKMPFWATVEMLTRVYETGVWPDRVTSHMQFYYKRNYPEFFKDGKKAERARAEKQEKARRLKAENRPSRVSPRL